MARLAPNPRLRKAAASPSLTSANPPSQSPARPNNKNILKNQNENCCHNIDRLEKDLDTTVVTWMNAMIWSSMRRGKVTGPIHGFGKLLASL